MAPEWIACRGATHSVVEGVVICPEGSFSPWVRCLSCRYLEAAEDDRDRECGPSSPPGISAAEHRIEPPPESWAALVIELL
jgi:hypothetical protein